MASRACLSVRTELSVGLGILILFAIAFSYLMMNVVDHQRTQENYPDWQGARWIKAGEIPGNGYFRKHFNVLSMSRRAYFMVAGSGEVAVYVNGKMAGSKRYFGARPSVILDVTRLLRTGENLLAVRVDSDILGVAPELAGRLVLVDDDGQQREITSDQSWLVLRHQDFQPVTKADWNSPAYNDLHWASADIVSSELLTPLLPLRVPEYVYKTFPRGDWIWAGTNKTAAFSNKFTVRDAEIHDAWLGVSTMGRYSLVINGVPVVSAFGTKITMELFNISRYLQSGQNEIWLEVENQSPLPRLLVSGSIITDDGVIELDSTAHWKSVLKSGVLSSIGQEKAVIVRTVVNDDMGASAISLVYKEIDLSVMLTAAEMLRLLLFSVVTLLLSLVMFVLFYRFCRNSSVATMAECFALFTRPFVLGLLIVAILLLLPYDLRIDRYFFYQHYMLLAVPVLVILFEVLILLEMRQCGKSLHG